MSSFISAALSLVEDVLPVQFGGGDHETIITDSPEGIVTSADGKTKLYAVCLSSSQKMVNMMSPALRRELKRLAERGAGVTTVENGVKYMFISRKSSPLLAR